MSHGNFDDQHRSKRTSHLWPNKFERIPTSRSKGQKTSLKKENKTSTITLQPHIPNGTNTRRRFLLRSIPTYRPCILSRATNGSHNHPGSTTAPLVLYPGPCRSPSPRNQPHLRSRPNPPLQIYAHLRGGLDQP